MQWLHFSDFHFGRKSGPQQVAMGSLIDFVRDDLDGNSDAVDAIFLAGDISYSGEELEYANFEKNFLQPLRSIPQVRNAKIFSVPGNHDVECDASTPITWDSIRERNQPLFFCENEEGIQVRKNRSSVFRHYWAFVERNGILSPNPFEQVSILYQESELPVDILSVNTAFFSDKDEDSSASITPCPLESIRTLLQGPRDGRPLIILGHHSASTFLKPHQKQFETLLVDKKAVYLHGHEHDPTLASNTNGTVRTIGFGATYVATLSEVTPAPYRNSFARCRLSDRLHLNSYCWDSHVGRWDDATRSQFAVGTTPDAFEDNTAVLSLPFLTEQLKEESSTSNLANIPRKPPQPEAIILIAQPSQDLWARLLATSTNVSTYFRDGAKHGIQSSRELDGKVELVTEQGEKRDLLVCIPGSTHILSSKEVESYNTRLDTEDYRSVTVLSLGSISKEAKQMYLRLKSRKSIEVLVNQEVTAKWRQFLSPRQVKALATRDAGIASASVLIGEDEFYLLVVQQGENQSFQIMDIDGQLLPATHCSVTHLREVHPTFAQMRYDTETAQVEQLLPLHQFDASEYLKKCYAEYNAIKYAALANVGIRFSDFSLEDVYIDASACEIEAAQSSRIDALLDDHLAAYPASEKLKAHIKEQLVSHVHTQDRQETSQAREFCQKYGAVLITGDPGSGKTCFVKSEVLAYAKRTLDNSGEDAAVSDWHSVHLPVFVPLSQAAAEPDLESAGLLQIAARLLERRGFIFPAGKIQELLNRGRLALFFDGLDEVVSVEKRALVVQHINDLVSECLPLGNRVVVTSRPAAINVVNLLPSLRKLELQGLTQSEIRKLAQRILTLNLTDTASGVVLETKELGSSDESTIKQLLSDCAQKPGVARFATNPLLLTLLVMIYANSGAPSAKRHRIYEEAVKTLASVRGRQAGHTPVSVQDLRDKLGAVALSVYRKESGLLPTKAEVIEIVQGVMSRQQGTDVPRIKAERFVQKVAESTGLITFGAGQGDDTAVVTFMHHSFMEYFAAVGLSRELADCDVVSLVTQPRWIEILTLLAGIVGETEDVTPVLARFVGDGEQFGDVDAKLLVFALDCALECEVPSEAAIGLLCSSITGCIQHGPARSDPWVRAEVGERLAQLIGACGLTAFEPSLVHLTSDPDGDTCAAAIALVSFACAQEPLSNEILKAFTESSERSEESVQCALCQAAARIKWARSPALLQAVARCLMKSTRCKRAAFEAVLEIPGLATKHWPEIINGLEDKGLGIRHLASRAAVRAGLDGDVATLSDSRKDVVANALRYVGDSPLEDEHASTKLRVETIDRLLNSGYLRDRLIGIQLIPAAEGGGEFAYRKLVELLRTTDDHQELTAILRTLRSSANARVLFSVADLNQIILLSEQGTADVRIAGTDLLGCFGGNTSAVSSLLKRDLSVMSADAFEMLFSALGRALVLQDEVVTLIEEQIARRTRNDVRMTNDYITEMCALLNSARSLGKNLRNEVSGKIRQVIRSYKQPEVVRRAALWAYASTAMPSQQVVEFLIELFRVPPPIMLHELAQSLGAFAKNCRQSIEYVMACVGSMSHLRDVATELHQRLSQKEVTADTEFLVSELRDGIHEVSQIIITFEEFINPVT